MSVVMKGSKTVYCSFCGKSREEVAQLIDGPAVKICDGCVDLCMDIVQKGRAGGDLSESKPWQPIKTAPRDGTWVLVRHPDATVPAVARPIGPNSIRWENFWVGGEFVPPEDGGWMPLP
jgi:hypothetical protein